MARNAGVGRDPRRCFLVSLIILGILDYFDFTGSFFFFLPVYLFLLITLDNFITLILT